MPLIFTPECRLNARIDGPEGAPALVLLHALGTDGGIWDGVVARMPHHRILRPDMRGHGASDVPPAPYAMGRLIGDVERLMDHFALTEAVVVGLSIGGLIAQGLAVKRLDLVRGLVLSNTAARLGRPEHWHDRIAALRAGGMAALHDATMERWLGRRWRDSPALPDLSGRFLRTPGEGWAGCAAAIAGTDFYETTATLRLPTLAIAGANDGVAPPDLVRETAELVAGHRFHLMRGAGHLPCVEQPAAYAEVLAGFLAAIGHA